MRKTDSNAAKRVPLASAAAAVLLASAPALAAISVWDGGLSTNNSNWSTLANWAGNVLPPPANDVQFASGFASGTTIQLAGNRTANSLIIDTLTPFTITGAPGSVLTLTSGIITRNDPFGTEGTHIIASEVALGGSGTWSIWGSGTLHMQGPISGAQSISKIGWGLLRLQGGGTYSGGTFVDEGLVQIDGSGAGTGPIVVAGGGGLDLNAATVANPLTLAGEGSPEPTGLTGALRALNASTVNGAVTLGSSSTINTVAGQLAINGVISGPSTANLSKTGSGELRLSAVNTYSGGTTLNAGRISIANASALGTGAVNAAIGTMLDLVGPGGIISNPLTISGGGFAGLGALHTTTAGHTWSGPINSPLGFTIGTEGSLLISGPITAPSATITKIGSSTLTLNNPANSFGLLNVLNGTLMITSEAGLPAAAAIVIRSGATAQLANSTPVNRSLTLSGNGGTLGALRDSGGSGATWSGPVILDANPTVHTSSSITLSGNITGAARTLIKTGPGLLFLSGTNSSFGLNVNEGTVVFQSGNAAPDTTEVAVGAAVELSGSFSTQAASTLFLGGSGIAGQGALRGTNGNSTWSSGLSLRADTTVLVNSLSNLTISGPILEGPTPRILTKTGPGTLTLSGNNDNLSGGMVIDAGTIAVNADISLGLGPVTVNGGKLLYTANTTTSRSFTLNSGRLQAGSGVTVTLNSDLSGGFLMGPGTFRTGSSISLSGMTTLAGSHIVPEDTTFLQAFINGGNLTSSAPLSWDGGMNLSSGVITVQANTLNTTAFNNDGVININSGATILNTGNTLTSGGGSRITINPGGILDVSGNSLHLNGALLVNNGTITGATNVNYGSLAKGSGVFGEVNVTDGGKFSPGNSPGSSTTGSTTWNSGGHYLIEIADALGSAGTAWDLWNINGILDINAAPTSNGRFTISLASLLGESPGVTPNFDPTRNYSWVILHAKAGIVGFDPAELALDVFGFKNNLAGGQFSLQSTSTELVVHFSAIPEPAATGMAVLASLLLLPRRNRKGNP